NRAQGARRNRVVGERAALFRPVRERYQSGRGVNRNQLSCVRECLREIARPLQSSRNRIDGGLRIALSQSFIVAENEPFAFQNGATGIAAELMALERGKAQAAAVIEEVIGVKDAVPLEVISEAVIV